MELKLHYYSHNIGDYRKDTSHLSLLEHGIYRQLLDSYYLDEKPLTSDIAKLMRTHCIRNADEKQSLENVLADFFTMTENGYVHNKCEQLIAQYHGKSEKARASAKARWKEKDANALRTDSVGNANHKPITKNQEPNKKKTLITPDGVPESLWSDFLKVRKAKKLAMTETALKGIQREADSIGKTLTEVLQICCENGWAGFKASWLTNQNNAEAKAKELPLGSDAQIAHAYATECGGDPTKARFNSYFEMKKFVLEFREKQARASV